MWLADLSKPIDSFIHHLKLGLAVSKINNDYDRKECPISFGTIQVMLCISVFLG